MESINKNFKTQGGIKMILKEISEFLQKGRARNVKELVEQAMGEGLSPKEILEEGLLAGMEIIGRKFKNNEVFVPEVLVAARAMNEGMKVLEPALVKVGNKPLGKIVIGTVRGDLHDIGKNLVGMMMKGTGFEVHDLGTDVAPETFIETAEKVGADIICMSALLTTTMNNMQEVIELLKEKGLRDKYIIMVGGAPITNEFSDMIGADKFTADAPTAAEVAKELVLAR